MISINILMIIATLVLGAWFLYKLKTEFSEKLFFKMGMILFLIQGFSNSIGLYLEYPILPFYATISKLASIAFNFLIAYFFYWLMNNAPASMGGSGLTLTEEQINEFMKDGS